MQHHRLFFLCLPLIMSALVFAQQPRRARQSSAHPSVQSARAQKTSPPAGRTYRVGATSASQYKMAQLTGIAIPPDEPARALAIRQQAQQRIAIQRARVAAENEKHPERRYDTVDVYETIRRHLQKRSPNQPTKTFQEMVKLIPAFDWRRYSVMAQVRQQGACSSCWAFAALAAFECSRQLQITKVEFNTSYFKEGRLSVYLPPAWVFRPPFSEQLLINCINRSDGGCTGGWHGTAFNYLMQFGAVERPPGNQFEDYTGKEGVCAERPPGLRALAWDYVHYPVTEMPTVEELKIALLEHGPLVVLMYVPEQFKNYRSGVFNDQTPDDNNHTVNHAMLLLGWSDSRKAWLIQNSYGENWGELCIDQATDLDPEKKPYQWRPNAQGGFIWVAWDSNRVGKYAAWVESPNVLLDGK